MSAHAVRTFDPIPGRHPRLVAWAVGFRRAGYPLREISRLFNVDLGDLVEAGVEP